MRKILWIIPAAIVVWLINANLVLSGTLEAVYDFTQASPYISELRPGGRLTPIQDAAQTIVDDPVFFSLRPPSNFDRAEVEITYQNHGQGVIELGAQAGPEDWQLDMRPIEVAALESLDWSKLQEGERALYAKNLRAKTIDDFLRAIGPDAKLATYRAGVFRPVQKTGKNGRTILGIRGRHNLAVALPEGPAALQLSYFDVNRNPGADPIMIVVRGAEGEVARATASDDGITSDKGLRVGDEVRTVTIPEFQARRGAYRVEISAGDDIAFEELSGYTGPMVFMGRLYLADASSAHRGGREVWVQGSELRARTAHETARQTLKVGEARLDIPLTHQTVRTNLEDGPYAISLIIHDVLLESDGLFALAREDIFEPEYPHLSPETDPSSLDAILATYRSPEQSGEWKIAQASFNVKDLYRRPDGYRFVISVPGIKQAGREVVIKQIKVILMRPGM